MNSFMTKFVTFLMVTFVIVFAGYQTFRYFRAGYKTEAAFLYEVPRFCDTKGLLIRTEEALNVRPTGMVRYLVDEGQRFRDITPIAETYATQDQVDAATERDALLDELETLQNVEKAAGSTHVADVQQLNNKLTAAVREFHLLVAYGSLEGTDGVRLKLVDHFGRKELIGGDVRLLGEHIEQLAAKVGEGRAGTAVHSDQAGYFSRYVDGFEGEFSPDMIKSLDAVGLKALVAGDYPFLSEAFGKSVTSHNWYYAATVSLDDVDQFFVGAPVTMFFMGGTGQGHTAVVDRVTKEENQAVVILKSDYVSSDSVSRRVANVRIEFQDYSGLRIPKEALRFVEGKRGVYVRVGSQVKFKEVEIVYTGDDFYLAKTQQGSERFLNLFEEVIVEGKDLFDGKLID